MLYTLQIALPWTSSQAPTECSSAFTTEETDGKHNCHASLVDFIAEVLAPQSFMFSDDGQLSPYSC